MVKCIGLAELDVTDVTSVGLLSCQLNHLRRHIDTVHPLHMACDVEAYLPRSTTKIEHDIGVGQQ